VLAKALFGGGLERGERERGEKWWMVTSDWRSYFVVAGCSG
jgi:hypothetical protein